jgi:hypothetical protein
MSNQSVRLTFSYDGSKIKLLSQQKVDMIAPPSDSVEDFKGRSGFWFELRDTKGEALYRRVAHPPIEADREVFSNDPKESIQRQPVESPKGVFTVVIPDHEKADTVSLHSSPTEKKDSFQAASELNTFKLTYRQNK